MLACAESAVLLRGAALTSGAQKLVTRPTGGPEEGTTATGGAQRAEGVELGKSDVQWPAAYGCGCGVAREPWKPRPGDGISSNFLSASILPPLAASETPVCYLK